MQTRRVPKILLILGPILLFLSVTVVLLETAFFHINPIKIGFDRLDYGRYVISARKLSASSDYETISTIMSKTEAALGLHYREKIQIILCEKQSDLNRFQPFLSAVDRRNAIAVAPWPNTIYITPKAEAKYGSILRAVGHEITHILLIQNYGIVKATLLWKLEEWIPEGIAIYINNWPDYFSKDRLLEEMKQAGVDTRSPDLLSAMHAREVPLPIRYMIYRFFFEYLFRNNPETTVIQFVKETCNEPKEMEIIFKRYFKDSFESYVKMFWKSLNEKSE